MVSICIGWLVFVLIGQYFLKWSISYLMVSICIG